jgi:nuclear receptor subfamily 1 group F protein 4
VSHVRRLNLFISRSLRAELNKNHHHRLGNPYDNTTTTTTTITVTPAGIYDTLLMKIQHLRNISQLHMDALTRFRRLSPEIEFPALHRELFSTDISE